LRLFLVDRCNIKCAYFYQGDYKEGKCSIDPVFAKAGIDKYIGDGTRQTDRLRFYAVGEPTLKFDLSKKNI